MINEGASAGHLLSTDEEFGIEPIAPVHFTKQRLRRIEEYEGPVSQIDDAHAEALLCELLLAYESELPLPPCGLPGVTVGWKPDPAVMRLLQIGFDYFVAVAERRPRRQITLFREMEAVLDRARAFDERQREDAEYDRNLNARAGPSVFHPRMGPHQQQQELVYFIASESGPIKIGMAIDPEKRLKGLQTGHHEKLTILATCSGGREQEGSYHQQFGAYRLNGEWFERSPEILAEIERLAL